VQDLGCMVGGEEPSICFVITSCVFLLVFKEYFSIIFVISNSTETTLRGFERVYRSKVMVWPRGIMSARITSSAAILGFCREVEVRRSHLFCLP